MNEAQSSEASRVENEARRINTQHLFISPEKYPQ